MTKQTFQIPEGCKAITMEQIGNQIVTTFEVEFKKGDVLISHDKEILIILKEYTDEDTIESYLNSTSGFSNYGWGIEAFRLATPEEAQRLWDALAKQGKRWNPETMQVEDIKKDRWRGESEENYCFLNSSLNIVTSTEDSYNTDDIRYNSGNYFQTKEQAEKAKAYIEEALNDFWEEELK